MYDDVIFALEVSGPLQTPFSIIFLHHLPLYLARYAVQMQFLPLLPFSMGNP